MSELSLINKYRPTLFKQVIGQEAVVKSIQSVLKKGIVHSFILTGPSGSGKTTIARIIAQKVQCDPRNIIEVDAASRTGVDDMRSLIDGLHLSSLGQHPNRIYIIDEAHMLSKAAWNSLLKSIEEPPSWVYWALLTTESIKVLDTINTRCARYQLSRVPTEQIDELLQSVVKAEKWEVPEEVTYFIAERSEGSPRQALSFLAQCCDCRSRKEAAQLLRVLSEEGKADVGKLCQAIMQGASWERCCKIIEALGEVNPESIRIVVCNWFEKVALSSTSKQKTGRALAILQAFGIPYPAGTQGRYPLLLSLGEALGV